MSVDFASVIVFIKESYLLDRTVVHSDMHTREQDLQVTVSLRLTIFFSDFLHRFLNQSQFACVGVSFLALCIVHVFRNII